MGARKNDILEGTLALLILRSLSLGKRVQEGWVRAGWGVTEKNREARFYTITASGQKQLKREKESWTRLTEGVPRLVRDA